MHGIVHEVFMLAGVYMKLACVMIGIHMLT